MWCPNTDGRPKPVPISVPIYVVEACPKLRRRSQPTRTAPEACFTASVAPCNSHQNTVAQPTKSNFLRNLFFPLKKFLLKELSSASTIRSSSSDSQAKVANFLKNSVKCTRPGLSSSFCFGCLKCSAWAKSVPHLQLQTSRKILSKPAGAAANFSPPRPFSSSYLLRHLRMVRGRANYGAHGQSADTRRAPSRGRLCRRTDRAIEPTGSARKHSAGPSATPDFSNGTAALRQNPISRPHPLSRSLLQAIPYIEEHYAFRPRTTMYRGVP